jgi:hypothetical protein
MRFGRSALGLLAAFATVGCGRAEPVREAAEPTTSIVTTTSTTTPYDGRLHVPFQTAEYAEGSASMGSWKIDVAPAEVQPKMTADQVVTRFQAGDFGRSFKREAGTFRAYFGVFHGNAPNPNAPDGRLTGTHPIGGVAAWLILVEGISGAPSGPALPAGVARPSEGPMPIHAFTVYSDDPVAPLVLTGLQEEGGPSPLVY